LSSGSSFLQAAVNKVPVGWHVVDVHEAVELLLKRGIIFNRYPGLSQDEQGIWTTPDGNKIAWFTDLDGNTLSLTEIRHD